MNRKGEKEKRGKVEERGTKIEIEIDESRRVD